MYMLPCKVSRLPGGSISFGLAGWLVVTSVVAGGLAEGLRAGALAMVAALFAVLTGGTIGGDGALKEIVFFSGTASDTEATGEGCAMVTGVEREGGRVSFCATLAAGFDGAASGLTDAGFSAAAEGSPFAALRADVTLGTMEAILFFSTSTNPKSVLTLNMLSSYATITP